MSVVLAVDLGGTGMKGAVVTDDGATIATETRPTPALDIVEALIELLLSLSHTASELGHEVIGAGIVTPGIVDEETGVVRYASNLAWRDMPLLELLTARLDVPVAVGHDVRAAGLAERLLGAARGVEEFVLIPIGTGVAAALVTMGRTITGATGAAGEFGHIPVIAGGEICACGQRGCLEVYASGGGVARRYAARGGAALSSRQIVARLGTDPIADAVWQEAVDVLAQGLVIMTLILDPGVIVLGGGFSQAGPALMKPLGLALADGLAWRGAPEIVLSQLGDEAGRIGAAVLAFQAAGRSAAVETWSAVSLR
jgi:glucokinase